MIAGFVTGAPLYVTGFPEWGLAFIAGGVVVSVLAFVVPASLDVAATWLVRRAHRLKGLDWPPIAQELVDERREAAQHVTVELEHNAGKIGVYLGEKRYWNTKADPLVAETFHRYSPVLSRDVAISALYRRIASLYNETDALNRRVNRAWQRQRHQIEDARAISEEDRLYFRDVRRRLGEARRELARYADNL